MQLHELKPKTKNKKRMTVGRGGKRGKTSGRGTKGQNARAGHKNRPELRDFIKRIPKLRGRGVSPFKSFSVRPANVSIVEIEATFKAGEAVTPKALVEKNLVKMFKGKIPQVKILSSENVSMKLSISGCLVSDAAKAAIEKAGGTVVA